MVGIGPGRRDPFDFSATNFLQLRCCYPEFGVNGSDRGDVWAAIGRTAGKPGKCGFRVCVLSGPQGLTAQSLPKLEPPVWVGQRLAGPCRIVHGAGGTGTRLRLAGEEEVRLSRERDTYSAVVAVIGPPGGLASQIAGLQNSRSRRSRRSRVLLPAIAQVGARRR
jgi:hypothetical protein